MLPSIQDRLKFDWETKTKTNERLSCQVLTPVGPAYVGGNAHNPRLRII